MTKSRDFICSTRAGCAMSEGIMQSPQSGAESGEATECDSHVKDEEKLIADEVMTESSEELSTCAVQPSDSPESDSESEKVTFTLIYSKTKHTITWPLNSTISSLKLHIHSLTKVPPAMQKLMYRGMLKDNKTLSESGVTNGIKMMVIGSRLTDVMSVNKIAVSPSTSRGESRRPKESLCKQKPHAKIIEKGLPDDVMPGYINGHEGLPSTPLKGMQNTKGNKVRLTFKLETDELWLGTKDRTEKIPLTSIKDVLAAEIEDHPGYHFLGLQLGPTERSRYWVYWVPSQYVEAIKDVILGRWKAF